MDELHYLPTFDLFCTSLAYSTKKKYTWKVYVDVSNITHIIDVPSKWVRKCKIVSSEISSKEAAWRITVSSIAYTLLDIVLTVMLSCFSHAVTMKQQVELEVMMER